MAFSLSVPELISDLTADAAGITFDMPGGGYDKLHKIIESTGALPKGRRERIALIALVIMASRVLKQQLGRLSPVANFVNELGEDGLREEAKRILEGPSTASTESTPRGTDAVWRMDAQSRTALLSLIAQLDEPSRQRLGTLLQHATGEQLAVIASVPPAHLAQLLELLDPSEPKRRASPVTNGIHAVNGFLFPWMRSQ